MRGVDGMRAPMSPDVVFSSTALRAASPDGGLKLFKQPGWTSGAQVPRAEATGPVAFLVLGDAAALTQALAVARPLAMRAHSGNDVLKIVKSSSGRVLFPRDLCTPRTMQETKEA